MPGHHSLFWKLALLLSLSAVLTVALSWNLTREVADRMVRLDDEAKTVMRGYAADAYRAWKTQGETGVAAWLERLSDHEPGDAMVVDSTAAAAVGSHFRPVRAFGQCSSGRQRLRPRTEHRASGGGPARRRGLGGERPTGAATAFSIAGGARSNRDSCIDCKSSLLANSNEYHSDQ